jgi:TPR repeat protein
MYENGFGSEKDGKRALDLYMKAANSGNTLAMSNVSSSYRDGISIISLLLISASHLPNGMCVECVIDRCRY